ncbi:hypothetical protein KCP74_23660 [Salmonella enterica subsp. enterica]|nr:hypothetical protein KCP74_23660 [Salmonella enterica subsp. enterica]
MVVSRRPNGDLMAEKSSHLPSAPESGALREPMASWMPLLAKAVAVGCNRRCYGMRFTEENGEASAMDRS